MVKSLQIISVLIWMTVISCDTSETSKSTISKNDNGQQSIDTLYPIIQDSLFGFINNKGEIIIKPQFEKAAQFSEGLAYFERGNKYGFINLKGEIVIQPVYEKKSRGWLNFFVEPFGESYFKEGLAIVNKNGMFGFINKKGEEVIPARFSVAQPFSQGFACVRDNQGIYFINKEGEQQFGRFFEWAQNFNDGLAGVMINEKWGYINTSGKMVIEPAYYTGGMFIDGYTTVKDSRESKTWKLINKKGTVQFEKQVARMHKASGNVVYFNQDRNEGILDLKGQVIIPAKFDLIIGFIGNTAIAKADSKEDLFGLINKKGEWILPPTYDGLFPADDKMIMAFTKNGELGYIDNSGKVIWKPTK